MEKSVETISGDTEGASYAFPVFRFKGNDECAPRAYLQAALHAGELPGTAAINVLMPMLRNAEAENRIRGHITLVPQANPIGREQHLFGTIQGRFHLGTRTNFNRDFPLPSRPEAASLPPPDPRAMADARLKRRLVELSVGHDIVLDLHCDDEGVAYLYTFAALWPAMSDCAAALGLEGVILWREGEGGRSFEEASVHPYLRLPRDKARLDRLVVATIEYRGVRNVDRAKAESDASGLYRFLVLRGVVKDPTVLAPQPFSGAVATTETIETLPAPKAGFILYDVKPGDRVEKGQRLASVVHAPGEEGGGVDVLAPQSGFIFTRRSHRSTRAGDDLLKLAGDAPSAAAKHGTLED